MDNPIKDSDDHSYKDSSSFVSKDTRDRSLHRLLLALGIAGTIMAIIILFSYSVSYESVALSEVLDTPSPSVSNELTEPEEDIVEPERLVDQVLVTDDLESAEILEQEEQPIEVEEILPIVNDESKNTTAMAGTITLEPISIPVMDNLTATVEDISEEREDEDPNDEDQRLRHDDSEDEARESQSSTTEDIDDMDDTDDMSDDDIPPDYPEDDDRTGHERTDRHDKKGDGGGGNNNKNHRS